MLGFRGSHAPLSRGQEEQDKMAIRTRLSVALAMAASLTALAACETPAPNAPMGPNEPTAPGAPTTPAPPPGSENTANFDFSASGSDQFDAWRTTFAARARSSGRSTAAIIEVLDDLIPVQQQVSTAAFEQAEFIKPIWDYAQSAMSPTRIANGRTKLAATPDMFSQLEQAYAPPREILAAIWGMESSYGGYIGTFDAPAALATQAADGRRKDFNEGELMAIMQLIEDGSATREQFRKASWAGAVGQTQFMPSTFLAHARDFDRDGRKDLWNNTGDALASAANYLSASGWRKGEPWAVEATIPAGFDYSLGDGQKKSVAAWKALGLAPATAPAFSNSDILQAELFLPAGSYGPAFLLFDNFTTIKRYNNADSYALAVGLLADQLAGRPQLSRPWPDNITMLTPDQARELQSTLNGLGYNAGGVDGIIGRNTRRALQAFQKDRGLTADGFPTVEMLTAVQTASVLGDSE